MLVIRLQRTGRKNYPSFRIVLAEKSAPIKGRFIQILGNYNNLKKDKKTIVFNKEKILEMIAKGAKPSNTVARLLKKEGLEGMDKFIYARETKRKKKAEIRAEKKESDGKDVSHAAEKEEGLYEDKKEPAEKKEEGSHEDKKEPAEKKEEGSHEDKKEPAEKKEEGSHEDKKEPAEKKEEGLYGEKKELNDKQ